MVRRPLLACPSDYDGPLRLVGRFLRKAAAPPRACAARLHMRANTEGLCACCAWNYPIQVIALQAQTRIYRERIPRAYPTVFLGATRTDNTVQQNAQFTYVAKSPYNTTH